MSGTLDRRCFVKVSAAGLAAGTLSSCLSGASPGDGRTLRLSTSSIMYSSLSMEEVCRAIAGVGIPEIDVWDSFGGCKHQEEIRTRLKADGFKRLLKKYNLKLYSYSVYRDGLPKETARLLGSLGGAVVVRGSEKKVAKGDDLVSRMKAFLEKIKPLADRAGENRCRLAIENHGNALLHTPDSFKAFVDLNRHPAVGIALAPYHIQGIPASVPDVIRIVGKQLLFFYAWQRGKGEKQMPGIGKTDFLPWLRALSEVGYKGTVNPFMHGHPKPETMSEAVKRSIAYLRECGGKI